MPKYILILFSSIISVSGVVIAGFCPDKAPVQDIVSSARGNELMIIGKAIIHENHIWTVVDYGEPRGDATEGYGINGTGGRLSGMGVEGENCHYAVSKNNAIFLGSIILKKGRKVSEGK